MEVKRLLVTPLMAQDILKLNQSNRAPKIDIITKYSKEMLGGRWKESTGELIKISKTGELIDGQHRLMALVRANISLYFDFAYGLEYGIFDVIDSGATRTAKDSLSILGVSNAAKIAAIIVAANRISKRRFYTENASMSLSNSQIVERYLSRKEMWGMVVKKAIIWQYRFSSILPYSTIGSFYVCFAEKSESKANEFFDQLCDLQGTNFPAIAALKKKLTDAKIIKTHQMTIAFKYALIIMAWNKFRANDKSIRLLFDPKTEKYPEIN